jgi:hypothetical protein
MTEQKDFDIVVSTLQQEINLLWRITESNIKIGLHSIMDDIRLSQISQLKQAIVLWETKHSPNILK